MSNKIFINILANANCALQNIMIYILPPSWTAHGPGDVVVVSTDEFPKINHIVND